MPHNGPVASHLGCHSSLSPVHRPSNALMDTFAADDGQLTWALTAAEVFFYGTYFSMFAFYMHVSRARNMAKTHRFLHISTITLFILATAHCALQLATTVINTKGLTEEYEERIVAAFLGFSDAANTVYVTSTVIADSIFIFRCYSIWNRRLAVIVFPAFLVLVTTDSGDMSALDILNHVNQNLFIASIAVSLFTTVVLMGLTVLRKVGRIWLLARAARVVMGHNAVGTYYTACAMILESGALYCVGGTAFVAVWFRLFESGTLAFTGAILGQIGIAPTLIAVRVALGCSVEGVSSFVVQPRATRPPLIARMEAATPESLDDRVLCIHATEYKAAI
ncbi:hypothetical protein B0H16DRAFT_727134 [Mycena metata]|uniref:Uncharacterized protein n=1 Tax=Mycena metata TaxID=1033252 RepID=A0AAD7NY91_9AGAR|nr:hypothetical protein B0H16DRAFT_727134 [Mycena metata]